MSGQKRENPDIRRAATHEAAMIIIAQEKAAQDRKTAKLRALRESQLSVEPPRVKRKRSRAI